jgi:hypothetical protein
MRIAGARRGLLAGGGRGVVQWRQGDRYGCVFLKQGKKHDVYMNPRTGIIERVPRHPEINEMLAKAIIRKLS